MLPENYFTTIYDDLGTDVPVSILALEGEIVFIKDDPEAILFETLNVLPKLEALNIKQLANIDTQSLLINYSEQDIIDQLARMEGSINEDPELFINPRMLQDAKPEEADVFLFKDDPRVLSVDDHSLTVHANVRTTFSDGNWHLYGAITLFSEIEGLNVKGKDVFFKKPRDEGGDIIIEFLNGQTLILDKNNDWELESNLLTPT